MNRKKYFIPISFVIIVLVVFLLPYYNIFGNRELSIKAEDWGSFGNYLSGIIGIINLGFFIYISILLSNRDEERSKIEINTQKLITLTQFRQSELEKLTIEFDKPHNNNGKDDSETMVAKFTYASIYLTTFFRQKGHLFYILRSDEMLQLRIDIDIVITEMIVLIKQVQGRKPNQNETDRVTILFNKYHNLSADLIYDLQVFIIKELA